MADVYDQQIATLQSQYDAIGVQIQSLQGDQTAATAQAVAVEQQVAGTQASLQAVEAHMIQLNTALATTDENLQEDGAHLTSDKSQLSQVMVVIYTAGGASAVTGLVDSPSVSEFMDRLVSAQSVGQKVQAMIAAVRSDEQALDALRQTQQTDLASAAAAQTQLESLQSQLQAQQAQLQQQITALGGQVAGLVTQRQSLLSQIATVRAQQAAAASHNYGGGILQPFAFGSINDDYPWGQCTWYVASLRTVTWMANAKDWFEFAQWDGYLTGMTPEPGAIVVWGGGHGYNALYGHVAYVVAVSGPSHFTVDEANYYLIPGQVDQRQVNTLSDVEGFIY
jgi:surface antigen